MRTFEGAFDGVPAAKDSVRARSIRRGRWSSCWSSW